MMRRGRFTGVATLLAMILAFGVLCPCGPAMAASASEGAHDCCAGKAGLRAASATDCCAQDSRERSPAVPSVSVALVSGWGTPDAVTIAAPPYPAPPLRIDGAPPSAAPLILRV